MSYTKLLEHDKFYHIYNRGINGENLFREKENYQYFLKLYDKYIDKIADTFAWCLMPNHFHFLVRIKNRLTLNLSGLQDLTGFKKPIHQYFSNLFNAYTKAYNKRYQRHGSLFERPFKRICIDNDNFYKNVLIYIHNNPVYHGFVSDTIEYPWTSFPTYSSEKETKLKRDEALGWFNDRSNFEYQHQFVKDKSVNQKYYLEEAF